MSYFNNPIPRTGLPSFREASSQRTPRDYDANARLWQKGKTQGENLQRVANAVETIQQQINRMRRRRAQDDSAEAMFPFRVFLSPDDPAGIEVDGWWRTFRVRAGAYGTTGMIGSDEADTDPDDKTYNPNPDFDATIDFVVPDATASYYVWMDITDPDVPEIGHSATIPGSGTDDAWWGGNYILIAVIDTDTYSAEKRAVVRQYLRTDVPKCG